MNAKIIKLKPEFEKAVMDLGFSEFTEIQEKCIPLIQQGKDVIGQSYTGSGKTAAFGFPCLEKVQPEQGLQMLVIVPTRELCNQVAKELVKFSKYRKTHIVEVYGGVGIVPQINNLKTADVVVGTPGRLLDHLSRRTMQLREIKILVLDEADKMFDMGFIRDIKKIIAQIPNNSQRLLFSATMPPEVIEISKKFLNNPEKVKMQSYVDKGKLIQHFYEIERHEKFSLLCYLIKKELNGLVIVFCGARHAVDSVNRNLNKQGLKSHALHGGLTQNKRAQVMDAFRENKLDVLVASDIAARGLDIKNVSLIVNYDIPKTSEEYVHRIGRTARAGCDGRVISLLSSEDHNNFRRVIQDRSLLIERMETPKFDRLVFAKQAEPEELQDRVIQRPQRSQRQQNSQHRGFSGQRERSFGEQREKSFSGDRDFSRSRSRNFSRDRSSRNKSSKVDDSSFGHYKSRGGPGYRSSRDSRDSHDSFGSHSLPNPRGQPFERRSSSREFLDRRSDRPRRPRASHGQDKFNRNNRRFGNRGGD